MIAPVVTFNKVFSKYYVDFEKNSLTPLLLRVHLDRVALQWEVATWLKNLLVMESLPPDMLTCLMT